eukprot:CAMPEP_0171461018 /NCGR_PEP_ID=MMETSP0945-20130129/5645_1 /TAXON_ID=109269 /ORGANISM="Vaucheria litorea, Strain CCMP2940" /LENGTH=371 /DNA_ID=CAMNT_0011987303 /DNA_START=62 /DNA_END=1174 /DNA_ORIENTATION=-
MIRLIVTLTLAVALSFSAATPISSCLAIKDQKTCSSSADDITKDSCVWCSCKAVPSECVSASMAKKLPSAVFSCDLPSKVLNYKSEVKNIMEQAPQMFDFWRQVHSRDYVSEDEEKYRYKVFQDTLHQVASHNLKGASSYTLGLNKFSDISFEEFTSEFIGAVNAGQNCSATHLIGSNHNEMPHMKFNEIPNSIDWREMGVVSPVKDQGRCGSCWAFSTTGCLESHHTIKTGEKILLSEQQLVDCAQDFDNHGCNGGLPSHAFQYIHSVGGLDTEKSYTYKATDESCKFNGKNVGATVQASVNITFQDEDELLKAVGSVGPVSIAYEVADDFKSYAGGVYDNPDCDTTPDKVNHAVLAVGYDFDAESGEYW